MAKAQPRSNKFKIPGGEEDRITSLPDFVLASILSFLPRTEDAIRTSILSKRWKLVWTQLPNLHFRYNCHTAGNNGPEKFANYVERTLLLRPPSFKIKAFLIKVDAKCACKLGYRLGLWICFATRCRVEKLSLKFFDGLFLYLLPQLLYHNDSLREMKLKMCDFRSINNGKVSWNALKELKFRNCQLTDEAIGIILSGTPALVSLKLYFCAGINRLDISSRSLKKLSLAEICSSFSAWADNPLPISCPSVECLEILGTWCRKLQLRNTSSLVTANLDFNVTRFADQLVDYNVQCRKLMVELLERVSRVEELRMGCWCVEVLSDLEANALRATTLDCTHLVLKIPYFVPEADLPGISILLGNSPKLEKFVVDITERRQSSLFVYFDCYGSLDQSRISRDGLLNCLLTKLKTVEIVGLGQYPLDNDRCEFELMEFLLAKAPVLEKMVIREHGYSLDELVETRKKLSNFRRSSPRAVVLISS